ncbi:MAG: terminase family protein [Holosporales bacterium]|nr:terminase family protein [Holosporales bacterium]
MQNLQCIEHYKHDTCILANKIAPQSYYVHVEQCLCVKQMCNNKTDLINTDKFDWSRNARSNQKLPVGDWRTWLIVAGRGFGKTRTGAESVRQLVDQHSGKHIALIGQTLEETRSVMIEGVSGILAVYPPNGQNVPSFEYSKRRLSWPNGAIAQIFGADRYDRLRGPQFDLAWIDEFAKFRYPERLYEQVMLGLRLGVHPRCIITTTPRPIPFLRDIIEERTTVLTKGTTFDNEKNLSPSFIDYIKKRYGESLLGRQELYADILYENENALWNRSMIKYRTNDDLVRIVIAIDPAVTYNTSSDETGIIVIAKNNYGIAFVLDDASGKYHPNVWGKRIVEKFHYYKADRVVAEVNQGGDLVGEILRSFDATIPYTAVRATRGKFTRAEPIAALYEQERIFHICAFPELEDQMCNFVPGQQQKSPDRMDALVWGATELFKSEIEPTIHIWN